ncbi:hypothetical protein C8Q76DRAFT_705692 [Earliella scabrosa]|nr:hypothetical protein C8Q76DRAFT_705692 [Earliella scabrosa]
MFARGSRFPSAKGSEIPGPGAYNPHDPEYDAYKRGAFLEKTNRFNKDQPSDVPGPGAYDTDATNTQNRPPTRNSNTTTTDRLAILQRKLEELERVHVEEKKAHHLEQERLKLELSRAQRTAAEQTERADKLKKQNDALDARVQELKKTSAAEQAELRELRMKLRTSEHERTQLAAKQGDAAEVRKAEARRKEELKERDRKIAELEKTLGAEKRKREAVETKLQEAKAKTDERIQEVRAAADSAESRLRAAEMEAQAARDALEELETRAEDAEDELLAQLEQHRSSLARVAEEYGRLASTSISLTEHRRVKQELTVLQLRNNRLERKLGNSDAQVVELANLIRQVKEQNALLTTQLYDAQQDAVVLRQAYNDLPLCVAEGVEDLGLQFAGVLQAQRAAELEIYRTVTSDLDLWDALDRSQKDALLFHSSVLNKELAECRVQLDDRQKELVEAEMTRTQLSEALAQAQAERAEAQHMLAESAASVAESTVRAESLKKELELVQAETRAEIARAEQSALQEKEANRRLAASLHQVKQAEQFLRAEVEQLSSDLAEAEKYVEAYNGLLAEVDALVVKNALAEEEAQRLSKFNAEILGHNNPAQRIVYVDRIRRELHETKHKLLLSTRDRDAVLADNDELRAELEMYKSVAVPQDVRPRTTITRVARVHSSTSESDLAVSGSNPMQGLSGQRAAPGPTLASISEATGVGDMTLDELM